jgi:hypothetical protein
MLQVKGKDSKDLAYTPDPGFDPNHQFIRSDILAYNT